MHQFGLLSEKGGVTFLNLLQNKGVPRKGGGGVPSEKWGGGSNPGGNYAGVN